ncbi:hypothetical protein [Embleya sp. AB8]|uniref:hypothetical protein n=1 Tax=Embleya sp. AB8 TaxID=3156304 RepID=UPI003C734B5B
MTEAPTLLRVLMTRRHWQVYETFRQQFERAASDLARDGDTACAGLTISKRTMERWYGGEVRSNPHPPQCRVLEHLFGQSIDVLLAPPPPALPVAAPAAPPGALHRGASVPRSGDRFGILPEDGAGTTGGMQQCERQVAMAARRAAQFMRTAEAGNIGQETLDQIHDDVHRLALSYQQVPLPVILGDLLDVQEDVFGLLEHGRVKPMQARDLYLLAAITSGMLAKASHDTGNAHAALTQARTAYVCADNADHQPMRAWVRGLQSLITYWAGRTEDAARYAALGGAILPEGAGTTGVWLSCLSARAHGILRDGDAARAAIERAERLREHVVPDDLDSVGGLFAFGEARQIYYAGEALVHLDPADRRAETTARASVEAYRAVDRVEWAFGDEAGAATNLALAQVAQGELDGAAEAVRPVLDLPAERRNFGIVESTRRVHAALLDSDQRRSPIASRLREEIEDYALTTTAAILR